MTKILRFFAGLAAALFITLSAVQATAKVNIPAETLSYKVMFKWGLINKKAGWARLEYTPGAVTSEAVLYAASEPWADRLYTLRDTLYSTIRTSSMTPVYYERVANEDGKYARDIIKFAHAGNKVNATTKRYRRSKPGAALKQADNTLQAEGATVDMLSAFYYIRSMPFARMQPGQQRIINIFSAKRKERLTITFVGEEQVSIDSDDYNTYHVKFRFTTEGSKQSSDDIDTWLKTDAPHIPVKLEGKLKIGKIMCLLER